MVLLALGKELCHFKSALFGRSRQRSWLRAHVAPGCRQVPALPFSVGVGLALQGLALGRNARQSYRGSAMYRARLLAKQRAVAEVNGDILFPLLLDATVIQVVELGEVRGTTHSCCLFLKRFKWFFG